MSSSEKKVSGKLVFNAENIGGAWSSRYVHLIYGALLLLLLAERIGYYVT